MPEAVKTAAPARKRTPAKKVAPQAAAAVDETSAEAAEAQAPVSEGERTTVTWNHVGNTKSWEKFQPPAGSGCAGNIYAPLGTTAVKTLFVK